MFPETTSGYVTAIILIFIFIVFVWAIVAGDGKRKELASLAVSLGIAGTFFGILIALQGFNAGEIDKSVPILIQGMKTAFITSVAGVVTAVFLRGMSIIARKKGGSEEISAQAYFEILTEQRDILKTVASGIGGEGDSSLLSQFQKLRLDMRDFLEQLSKSSSEEIVKALREVIQDFNTKINEQFGENFKELNQAVGRMVTWMQEHKDLVEASHKELEHAVMAMSKVADDAARIQLVSEKTETILSQTLQTLAKVVSTVDATSQSTDSLGRSNAQLYEISRQFATANNVLQQAMDGWRGIAQEAPQATEKVKELSQSVSQVFGEISRQQKSLVEQLSSDMKAVQKQNSDIIQSQFGELDRQLGNELSKALNTMGSKLASLSQQFVNDYQPLTERLREVVRLSENVTANQGAYRG